jgi:hypothetical protein
MMRLALTILTTISLTLTLAAADFDGAWKLNISKSKLSNDVASQTMKIEQTGPNSHKTTVDAVLKSGEKRHQEINRICDGKEHPAIGVGLPAGAAEICQQIDAVTRKVTQKRDGKLLSEFTSSVSSDGKVMTNQRTTGNVEEVLVFERQ